MSAALPSFTYHPDPLGTGSVVKSSTVCLSCSKSRGYIYVGPVYSVDELDECICPWCISDGSAHNKFDAEFTDAAGVGGGCRQPGQVDSKIIEEVAYRTPGFSGWQQERWLTCLVQTPQLLSAQPVSVNCRQNGPKRFRR